MAKNSIEKQKTALKGLSIAFLVLGVAGFGGGIALMICNILGLASSEPNLVVNIILLILGVILFGLGIVGIILGIKWLWVACTVKATNGSIADDNLSKGTVNGKVCPKCGCTNTPDVHKCQACGADLD